MAKDPAQRPDAAISAADSFRAFFPPSPPSQLRHLVRHRAWLAHARLVVPGSCPVISVASFDDQGLAKQLAEEYTAAEWHNHLAADVASFFDGLELVGSGGTEAANWRAWLPDPVPCHRDGRVLAGIGRVRCA